MADIFISYAREDRSRIEPLAQSLEELEWTVFWDRTIPTGKTWCQVIGDALKNARSVIVAWSKDSIESDWVQEEADRGRRRNILIPILIDNVDPPLGFGSLQAANLVNWDPSQSSPEFEKLIADISVILGPSPKDVKETEQAAEEECQRKQEEERRKTEERRRFEEELKRAEAERKAEEEERKLKEAQIEAERVAEEEHKKKQGEERKRFEEYRREIEERRKAEEWQKRLQAKPKPEEESKRREIKAVFKTDEEHKRKEAGEDAELARPKQLDAGRKKSILSYLIIVSAASGFLMGTPNMLGYH